MLFQFNEIYELIRPPTLPDHILLLRFFSNFISISSNGAPTLSTLSVLASFEKIKILLCAALAHPFDFVGASAAWAKSDFIFFSVMRKLSLHSGRLSACFEFICHMLRRVSSQKISRKFSSASKTTQGNHHSIDCCILMVIFLPLDLSALPRKTARSINNSQTHISTILNFSNSPSALKSYERGIRTMPFSYRWKASILLSETWAAQGGCLVLSPLALSKSGSSQTEMRGKLS